MTELDVKARHGRLQALDRAARVRANVFYDPAQSARPPRVSVLATLSRLHLLPPPGQSGPDMAALPLVRPVLCIVA